MQNIRSSFIFLLVAAAALTACGGSPAGPSGGLKLQGVLLSADGEAAVRGASAGRITITLREDSRISTTASINGTFELQGLPADGFTLLFASGSTSLGRIGIPRADETSQIKIVVQVTGSSVVLLDLSVEGASGNSNGNGNGNDNSAKSCLIEGGRVGQHIELEGIVDSGSSSGFKLRVNGNRAGALVDISSSGASFKCHGDKSSSNECKATVAAGAQVHVKGTLTSCSTTAAAVTATEVMVQK